MEKKPGFEERLNNILKAHEVAMNVSGSLLTVQPPEVNDPSYIPSEYTGYLIEHESVFGVTRNRLQALLEEVAATNPKAIPKGFCQKLDEEAEKFGVKKKEK